MNHNKNPILFDSIPIGAYFRVLKQDGTYKDSYTRKKLSEEEYLLSEKVDKTVVKYINSVIQDYSLIITVTIRL